MGIRPQIRVRASRAKRQPIFTPSTGSILGVQDKQRPQNDKWSYKLWSRGGALGGQSWSPLLSFRKLSDPLGAASARGLAC